MKIWHGLVIAGISLSACVSSPRSPTSPSASQAGSPSLPPTATVFPTSSPTPSPQPTFPATLPAHDKDLNEQVQAMRPAFEGDVFSQRQATRYWIRIAVDFDPQAQRATIDGMSRIEFTNPLSTPLDEIVLMLWPNDHQYRAEMEAGPLWVDGQLSTLEISPDRLVLRAQLQDALQPGEQADLDLPFKITTSGPIGGQRPMRFGITEGMLAAPTFYPLIPRLVDGQWDTDPAPPWGDTTNSEVAFYDVQITAPSTYSLVTSGVSVDEERREDGMQTGHYVSGPIRDFAFALGPFEMTHREVDGVEVRAWVLPDHRQSGERMLSAAAEQVAMLTELVGPYPYLELDLVDAPGAFGGIEYPGLVFIGRLGEANVVDPTVHEVGHQWFYALVGDDQLEEPWLDEAAATYTQFLYYERFMGAGRVSKELSDFRGILRDHPNPETPIGLSVEAYPSVRDYALFVYVKGGLFFDALRSELGDQVFFEFLRSYFATFRYRVATGDDFKVTAERACACDLTDLFDLWVYKGGEIPGP
jgi:hypothetical protein